LPLADTAEHRMVKRGWPRRLFDRSFFYNNTYARNDFTSALSALGGRVEVIEPDLLYACWSTAR